MGRRQHENCLVELRAHAGDLPCMVTRQLFFFKSGIVFSLYPHQPKVAHWRTTGGSSSHDDRGLTGFHRLPYKRSLPDGQTPMIDVNSTDTRLDQRLGYFQCTTHFSRQDEHTALATKRFMHRLYKRSHTVFRRGTKQHSSQLSGIPQLAQVRLKPSGRFVVPSFLDLDRC